MAYLAASLAAAVTCSVLGQPLSGMPLTKTCTKYMPADPQIRPMRGATCLLPLEGHSCGALAETLTS